MATMGRSVRMTEILPQLKSEHQGWTTNECKQNEVHVGYEELTRT
jgi:hypothetical protein